MIQDNPHTDQEIAVRVVKGSVHHALVGGVDQDAHAVLDADITSSGDRSQSLDKVGGLGGDVEGAPAQLVGGDADVGRVGVVADEAGLGRVGLEGSVADRGADAVEPTRSRKVDGEQTNKTC